MPVTLRSSRVKNNSFILQPLVMAVEVSDTVPVVAFGFPVPLFQER